MKLIDANVFIRYFIGDHRLKQDQSRMLFERIRIGQEEAFCERRESRLLGCTLRSLCAKRTG